MGWITSSNEEENISNDNNDSNNNGVNNFTHKKKKPADCITCDYAEHFQHKGYLQFKEFANAQDKFNGLKFLIFAPKNEVPQLLNQFCQKCEKYPTQYSNDEVVDEQYICGDTKLLVSHKNIGEFSKKQMEELEIRMKGLAVWGRPMRASGAFSNFALHRYFARDEYSFFNQPNSLLVLSQPESKNYSKLKEICKEKKITTPNWKSGLTSSNSSPYFQILFNATNTSIDYLKFHFVNQMAINVEKKAQRDGYASACEHQYKTGLQNGLKKVKKAEKASFKEGFDDGHKEGHRRGYDDAHLNHPFNSTPSKEYK